MSDEARTHIRLFVLVVLAFLPAVALYGVATDAMREWERDRQEEQLVELARLSAVEYRQLIEESRQLLGALAEFPEISQAQEPECEERLASILHHTLQYTTLSVIGPDGYMACGSLTTGSDLYLGDRAYYLLATTQGRFSVGEYALGRITGRPTVGVAYPIGGAASGRVPHVLAASLDLTRLGRFTDNEKLPSGTTLTVLDRQGNVLVRRPARSGMGPDTVGAQVPPDFPGLGTPRGGIALVTGRDLDGEDRLFAVARLSTVGDRTPEGFVVLGKTQASILSQVEDVARSELRLLAVAGIAVLLLTWLFGHFGLVRATRSERIRSQA